MKFRTKCPEERVQGVLNVAPKYQVQRCTHGTMNSEDEMVLGELAGPSPPSDPADLSS